MESGVKPDYIIKDLTWYVLKIAPHFVGNVSCDTDRLVFSRVVYLLDGLESR